MGYGVVSPTGDDDDCYPIRFACSLFAFMGLLFNSLSAATFFSKLERVLTRASVTFCSSACLQFGNKAATRGSKGVCGQFWMKERASSVESEGSKTNRSVTTAGSEGNDSRLSRGLNAIHEGPKSEGTAFPFLEFRIVNDHANHKHRSVRNARVTAMVQLSTNDAENARDALDQTGSSKRVLREYVTVASSSKPCNDSFTEDSKRPTSPTNNDSNGNTLIGQNPPRINAREARRQHGLSASIIATAMMVQESDTVCEKGSGPEGRVYYPLNLEPDDDPYFRKVFYTRHTLNDRSPLLKSHVREQIKKTGGWDPKACEYQDILASLVDFYRIRITFKGTSAVNNTMVLAQKVYTIEDVYVGWQFCQIFYKKERSWFQRLWKSSTMKQEEEGKDHGDDDNIVLDKRLIHDILPQFGGGQEPIEG